MTERPIDRVLARLRGVQRRGDYWVALCPSPDHDDQVQSLQFSERPNGSVGMWCHGGCSTASVLAALGLRFADLFAQPPPAGWHPREPR
jgi:hypothetical protein